MLTYTGEAPQPTGSTSGPGAFLKTIAILRIGAGVTLMFFHGWKAAIDAYQFLWREIPWNWVPALAEAGAPMPHITAPLAAAVVAAVAASWILGFLTRLFSAIFLPVAMGALVLAHSLDSLHAEACWLYIIIAATLTLFGSGNLSVDGLFYLARRAKKPQRGRLQ